MGYDLLDLPPDNNKKGHRREKTVREQLIATLRSWRATATRQESQGVYYLLISLVVKVEKMVEDKTKADKTNIEENVGNGKDKGDMTANTMDVDG